ncbi:MAG: ABC transporter ATP-binding protein [Rhodoferax sp.]
MCACKPSKKSFGSTAVIHGVSLDIASGEFVNLLGASGCGKTTLLRIVAGLESVSAGTVEIDGRDVTGLPPEQRDIAMMFRTCAAAAPAERGRERALPAAHARPGQPRRAAGPRAHGAGHGAAHAPGRAPAVPCSGGQQQRVALARAIVSQPKVLLLDEPLSNLDARLREDMQVEELIEIHKRLGLTAIFVTHGQEEALSLSSRIILLNARSASSSEATPAEIYARPDSAFASSFLGAASAVPVTIEAGDTGTAVLADGQRLAIAPGSGAVGATTLALRQEDLRPGRRRAAGPAGEGAHAGVPRITQPLRGAAGGDGHQGAGIDRPGLCRWCDGDADGRSGPGSLSGALTGGSQAQDGSTHRCRRHQAPHIRHRMLIVPA